MTRHEKITLWTFIACIFLAGLAGVSVVQEGIVRELVPQQFEFNGEIIEMGPLSPLVGLLQAMPLLIRFVVVAVLYGLILRRAGENLRRYGLFCVNLYCAAMSVGWAVVGALPEVSFYSVLGTSEHYTRPFQFTYAVHWWSATLAFLATVLFFVFLLLGLITQVRARLRN